jgi:hypothetical protein
MMSQPIAYALVAMVCYGVCDFIYKQAATAGIRADHFLMVQAWFFCSLVILDALATGSIVLERFPVRARRTRRRRVSSNRVIPDGARSSLQEMRARNARRFGTKSIRCGRRPVARGDAPRSPDRRCRRNDRGAQFTITETRLACSVFVDPV